MKSKTQQSEHIQRGWIRMYSGVAFVNSITQTEDGGYIVAGDTAIHATDEGGVRETEPTAGFGGLLASDIFVMKINSDGKEEWTKILGGNLFDGSSIAIQTNDGGYVVAGESFSFSNGYYGVIVAKLDKNGSIEWAKLLCDYTNRYPHNLGPFSFRQTSDGGYIVLNSTFIAKLDSKANLEWANHLQDVTLTSVCELKEGGYVCVGSSSFGFGANKRGILVLKLDKKGRNEWAKMIWGAKGNYDYTARFVESSDDGGCIIVGKKFKYVSIDQGEALIIKIDKNGYEEWTKVFSKEISGYAEADFVVRVNDMYIIGGSGSNNIKYKFDAFILGIDKAGNKKWAKIFYGEKWDCGYSMSSICKTQDDCIVATISPSWWSIYKSTYYIGVIKINLDGNLGVDCNYFGEYKISMNDEDIIVKNVTIDFGTSEGWSIKVANVKLDTAIKEISTITICDGR